MLNSITTNVCIYTCKYKCIKNVNIKLRLIIIYTCIILTNGAYTMYSYSLHTVRHLSTSSGEFHCLLHAPAMKCPRDEKAGNEVYPRRNGWRQSVPVTKRLATKCTHDEMVRRNGGNETSCSIISPRK